jgi:hypothetical protein
MPATAEHKLVTTDTKPQIKRTAKAATGLAIVPPATAKTPVAPKTPAASAPELDPKKGAALEAVASKLVTAAIVDAKKVAEAFAALYPYAPWDAKDMTVKAYFRDFMGIRPDNFQLPYDARRLLVTLMYTRDPKTSIEHVMAMAGAGERTIKRDRTELNLANPARVAAHTPASESASGDSADGEPGTTATTPRTASADAAFDLDTLLSAMSEDELHALITKAELYLAQLTAE